MSHLDGRVVLVTGGNGGIGLGLAEGCASEGADIVIWGTSTTKLDHAAGQLGRFGTRVEAQAVDVTDDDSVDAAFKTAVDRMGRVDAVFANAGLMGGARFVDQSIDEWRRIFEVNVFGAVRTLQAAARHMIDRGDGGSLVGVGSISTTHGAPAAEPYAASKGALLATMRGLAVELARHRIRCNTLVPGWTVSDMSAEGRRNERFVRNTTERTPIRRWGGPSDFRRAAAYLADPALMFHTGDELTLDGGYTRF